MREYSNLQWPQTPFGAEQRPFGRHTDMLSAYTIEWTGQPDAGALPVASTMVYLRVRRHGEAQLVTDETLSIGFRILVIGDPSEVPNLLAVTDQQLSGARRLGAILAGHHLDSELDRMNALSETPLRGAAEVLSAWANRAVKQRGMATMIDTAVEAAATGAKLGLLTVPVSASVPDCPACAAKIARCGLARCLAVGLTATVHTGRYTWQSFHLADAIDRAAWDVLAIDNDAAGNSGCDAGHSPPDIAAVIAPAWG